MRLDLVENERRRHERRPCSLVAFCSVPASGSQMFWRGTTLDLSRNGARLLLGRRFEVGTTLSVRFLYAGRGKSNTRLMRVAHVAQHEGGGWAVGCLFAQELDGEAFASLADEQGTLSVRADETRRTQ